VTDWAGEGMEGETLNLSKMGLRIIIFYCFYPFLKTRGKRRWFIHLSFPYYYLTNYLIILKIKEMFYQRNLTKYIKRYRRKNKKGCDIIVLRIELLVFGIAM
jgi:hypothetical protein